MWETIFIQPIFNSLVAIYNLVGDMGIAIILLTIVIQFLLLPLYNKQIKGQKDMKEIQPKMKKIQKKYKDDKEKQSKELMKLYQEEGVNPLGGCLPLLIQFPIFIAVYYVFRSYLNDESLKLLYSFVSEPDHLKTTLLGLIDLSQQERWVLPLLAGVSTYFQTSSMPQAALGGGEDDEEEDGEEDKGFAKQLTKTFSKQMKVFMPVMSFIIVMQLPAAVGIYWITRNIFTIIQQKVIMSDEDSSSGGDVKVTVEKE